MNPSFNKHSKDISSQKQNKTLKENPSAITSRPKSPIIKTR